MEDEIHHHLPSRDGTIFVIDHGPPSDPAVLFLHGTPATHRQAFAFIEPAKALGIRLLTCDRPGYGRSSTSAPSSIAGFAEDMRALVGALSIDSGSSAMQMEGLLQSHAPSDSKNA